MQEIIKPEWAIFNPGQLVEKVKGARWVGSIVGYYSTSLNPCGYLVESIAEIGNVQPYPEADLQPALFREGRPDGCFKGPLFLKWCPNSQTIRQQPENYLAADLSRIDSALWGRENEIALQMAEGPELVQLMRLMLYRWPDYIGFAVKNGEPEDSPYLEQARDYDRRAMAILKRLGGEQ